MAAYDWDRPYVAQSDMLPYVANDSETGTRYGKTVRAVQLSNVDYKTRFARFKRTNNMRAPPSCGRIFSGFLVVRNLGTPRPYETWMPEDVFEDLYTAEVLQVTHDVRARVPSRDARPDTNGQRIADHAIRMHNEAVARLHDADLLAQSLEAQSDSQSIIRILAFEVLLKCALLVSGRKPARSHNYVDLWTGLPAPVKEEILRVANGRMPGHSDLTDITKLLTSYKFVFEQARYYYELYEGKSIEEQRAEGQAWLASGGHVDDARARYYPLELDCLVAGLLAYIEPRLANGLN